MFNSLEIEYPILLSLFGLVALMIIIFLIARNKRKKAYKKIGDKPLVDLLLSKYRSSSFFSKFLMLALAMSAFVIALANLRAPVGAKNVTRSGVDVMIALDVSNSMLAEDVQPNRLERAKQMLSRLIDRMENNRIGIVIFAGKAYLQMPITGDNSAAKMYLNAASTQSVPTQGTVVGDALKMCLAAFNPKEKKYKAVVLVTDGEDHDEEAVKVAKAMADQGVVINAIGMGSAEGAPIKDLTTGTYKKDAEGNTVITKTNMELLNSISKSTNGTAFQFSNTDQSVAQLMEVMNTMPKRVVKDKSLLDYESLFQWLLAFALLALVAEMMIPEMKKRKAIKMRATTMVLLMIFGLNVNAQTTDREWIKLGNDAYSKKEYSKAVQAYEQALNINAENKIAQYNLAAAQYKAGKNEDAKQSYDRSAQIAKSQNDALLLSQTYYNKGVVLHNEKKIDECIEEYKRALRLNPNDEDARYNLQKALKKKNENGGGGGDNNENDKKNPEPSKMNRQDAEQKLKALMEQEKNLQDKLHKVNANATNTPEKDW